MAEVVSFRFREHELQHIDRLSHIKSLDKTSAARELIEYGWTLYVLKQYKEGRISIERTAKELHTTISELIDLLSELGISSPVTFEAYLEGLRNI